MFTFGKKSRYHWQQLHVDRQKAYARYHVLATMFWLEAKRLQIPLRWGGDWNGSWDTFKNNFDDLAHYELNI